jgi:hypothetical protein
LGYVVAPSAPAPVEPAAKPVADALTQRQTGGFGRVAAIPPGARPKPPEPVQYVKHYDKNGRETILASDIPW